ncbi:MAG: DUF3786 domain-containing protein [Candidatus Omnitrophota bacterium]
MGYEAALGKAWGDLAAASSEKEFFVRFFSDEYSVDVAGRKVLSLSWGTGKYIMSPKEPAVSSGRGPVFCNVSAKDFVSILILHYLQRKLSGLPALIGEWISFKELESGEAYYPAFRKRAIEPVLKKLGNNPQGLFSGLNKGIVRKVNQADAAAAVEAFAGVPILVEFWKGDDEFGPEANILFDRNISGIFCTEDVAVLAGFVAKYV